MIYLLRAGETQFTSEQRIQGRCDSPLTAHGREQARAAGTMLRELMGGAQDFEVVASPQPRASETSRIACEAARIDNPVITDARLQEVDCGSWEKHHFATICARDPLVAETPSFLSAWAHYCTDGESLDDAIERLWGWLRWAGSRNLVVIGHGVAGSILRTLYAGGSKAEMLACHPASQDVICRLDRGWVEEIPVRP